VTNVTRISLSDATDLIRLPLTSVAVPDGAALSVAAALVTAEAKGQIRPGVCALGDYVAQVRSGKINAPANMSLRALSPAALKNGIAVMGAANAHLSGALSLPKVPQRYLDLARGLCHAA